MDTKKCPYCGEEIMATAKKCRYCGEWLTDQQATPPAVTQPVNAQSSGELNHLTIHLPDMVNVLNLLFIMAALISVCSIFPPEINLDIKRPDSFTQLIWQHIGAIGQPIMNDTSGSIIIGLIYSGLTLLYLYWLKKGLPAPNSTTTNTITVLMVLEGVSFLSDIVDFGPGLLITLIVCQFVATLLLGIQIIKRYSGRLKVFGWTLIISLLSFVLVVDSLATILIEWEYSTSREIINSVGYPLLIAVVLEVIPWVWFNIALLQHREKD